MAKQQLGAAPSNAEDAVPKSYVDAMMAMITAPGLLPTGAIAQTFPRNSTTQALTGAAPTSGLLRMTLIWLPVCTVTSITFCTGSTAITWGTSPHLWASLHKADLTFLKQSTDDTSATAWGASTDKTFTLSSTQVITVAGYYYVGLLVTMTGGTMPTMHNASVSLTAGPPTRLPMTAGTSTGSLTATAPSPAGAMSFVAPLHYAYVS